MSRLLYHNGLLITTGHNTLRTKIQITVIFWKVKCPDQIQIKVRLLMRFRFAIEHLDVMHFFECHKNPRHLFALDKSLVRF